MPRPICQGRRWWVPVTRRRPLRCSTSGGDTKAGRAGAVVVTIGSPVLQLFTDSIWATFSEDVPSVVRLGSAPAEPSGPAQATVHVTVAVIGKGGVVGIAVRGGLARRGLGVGVRAGGRLGVSGKGRVVGGAGAVASERRPVAGAPRHVRRGGRGRRGRAPAGVTGLRGGGEGVPDRRVDPQPFGEVHVAAVRRAEHQRRAGETKLTGRLGAHHGGIGRRRARHLAGGEPLDPGRHPLDAPLGAEVHVPGSGLWRPGRRRTPIAAARNGNRVRHEVGALRRRAAPAAAAGQRRSGTVPTTRARLAADTGAAVHGLA